MTKDVGMRGVVSFLVISLMMMETLLAYELPITGTVVSYNQKMIGVRYMGYVKHIYFDIGDRVKREDTLFELESAEFDIMRNQADLALEQAQLMVDIYRTRLRAIKREKKRLKKKLTKDTLDDIAELDETADNVSAGLEAAQALVKSAAEKIKQISTISGYLEVKAPNDGIIVEKRIRVGDLVAPGMLGMVLVDIDHLQIEGEVAESDLKYVHKYQKVRVEIPSADFKTTGYIKAVVPSANPMSHTFKIVVNFNKGSYEIFPGMYARLVLEVNPIRNRE